MTIETFNYRETQELTHEQIAMQKVFDPYCPPYPIWHATDLKKFASVFKYGIWSKEKGNDLNLTIKSEHNSFWNNRFVSVHFESFPHSYGDCVLILLKPNLNYVDPKELNIYIDPKTKKMPLSDEKLVEEGILPEDFLGIIVQQPFTFSTDRRDLDFRYSRRIDSVFQAIINESSKRAIPIYFNMELVWPIHLNLSLLCKLPKYPNLTSIKTS